MAKTYSTGCAASMYYARERRRARQEASAGTGGGLRQQNEPFGLTMAVVLTLV